MGIFYIQELACNVILIAKQLKMIIANVQIVILDIIYLNINVWIVTQTVKHVLTLLIIAKVVIVDIIYQNPHAINALLHV